MDEHENNQDGFSGSTSFLFAKNPWSCDCEIVKDIQDFLYRRVNFLRDAEMLYCQGIEVCTLVCLINALCVLIIFQKKILPVRAY